MRLTTADLVVLAVMVAERPMHGYELVKLLEARDVHDWASVSRPQVYYSLRKLAAAGLLDPVTDQERSLGPERIVYQPSADAGKAVSDALAEGKWVTQRPPTPFITWAALSPLADPSDVATLTRARMEFLNREIKREQQTLAAFPQTDRSDIAVARILVSFAIRQFEAELTALDELQNLLSGGHNDQAG